MPTKPKRLHGSVLGTQRASRGSRSERRNDQRILQGGEGVQRCEWTAIRARWF